MAEKLVKTVRVPYGLFNNPNNGRIEKIMSKWLQKGYVLQSRHEEPSGCLASLLSGGWARGKTELTFVKKEYAL